MLQVRSVFLTGGTGFVGRAILESVAAKGIRVVCLVRPGSGPTPGAERVEGNVWEPGRWMEAVAGMDAVIHLVGIIQPYRDNTFQRVHVQGTDLVATAAREGGVRKIVHMSALGTRADAASEYHLSKWKAEELVRWAGPAFTILRPSIIFGPRCRFLDLLARLTAVPVLTPVAGPGTNLFQPVYVGDVARAFAQALQDVRTDGKEYELGGPERLSFDELLDAVREALGRGPRFKVHVPLTLMRAQAAVMEAVLPRPPVTRDQLLMLPEDNVCDPGPAREAFGGEWTPFRDWCRANMRVGAG